ncbi:MAG: hypothetical protein JWO90_3064, partial [Solirubrobacterales bacterium]|nr:hypothetical protein [Solirubrobacterales bacterium]
MRSWSPQQLAEAAGATLVVPSPDGVQRSPSGGAAAAAPGTVQHQPGPDRASIDSRDVGPGVLFVGLPGER